MKGDEMENKKMGGSVNLMVRHPEKTYVILYFINDILYI